MIVFPLAATIVALACAAFSGFDALQRPRPERVIWTIAFLVFAAAAAAEVIGSALGWTPTLARVYYLAGAVLVVGILALGELYLLFPGRMPAITPGLALLVAAIAATTVWSAPLNEARLQTDGWGAIERGPFLIALAASINAAGTLVLAGGALYSGWSLRAHASSRWKAIGCGLIAVGTVVVAGGGTLTRIGNREYLYLAMAIGVSIIFSGVLLTRGRPESRVLTNGEVRLVALPARAPSRPGNDLGIAFIVTRILPLDIGEIASVCRQWSATSQTGDTLSRDQAQLVWALRLDLPIDATVRFDELPLVLQAQIAELYVAVWSVTDSEMRNQRQA